MPRMDPWDLLTTLLGRTSHSTQHRTSRDSTPHPPSTSGVPLTLSTRTRITSHHTPQTRTRRCLTQPRPFSASGATCAPIPYAARLPTLLTSLCGELRPTILV